MGHRRELKAGSHPGSLNIYRALIDQKGEEAAAFAGGHADLLLEEGDLDGSAVWRRIRTAIEELL